ncbi:hypothetical protein BASA81_009081 [Batrachochytrium salamandrivorans]|nr:hypothetical protein BASA81_009081 [Batrachochytrium salamandrivorans]
MGMQISQHDQEVVNEFVEAAGAGDLEKVRELKDQQLNGKSESGDTALHVAAFNGRLEVCLELLDDLRALESDSRDSDLTTPLMLACNAGHLEVCQKLIRSNAKPGLVDIMGWSPLHHACSNGHAVVVGYLLDRIPQEAYFQLDSAGCSPLWLASASGDAETVRILLCYGGNPLECNLEGVSVTRALESDASERELILAMLKVACEEWTKHAAATASAEEEHGDLLPGAAQVEGGRDLFAKQGMADEGPGLYEYDEDDPPNAHQVLIIRQGVVPVLLQHPLFSKSYLPSLTSSSSRPAPPPPTETELDAESD